MLWHIELKFCIWLCFTVLQIKIECREFASIFVGVMPLLERRILQIHRFLHFSLTSFNILNWKFAYYFIFLYYRSSLSVVNLGLFWSYASFRTCIDKLRTVLVVYLSVPFLLKSSYTLLRIMLETVCIPPLTSLICEIKTRGLILWKYQVILVIEYVFIIKDINYALWHTFESKRYIKHGTHVPVVTCSHLYDAYRL